MCQSLPDGPRLFAGLLGLSFARLWIVRRNRSYAPARSATFGSVSRGKLN
jgi:hypothetical protein